jgi:hypothetical protein
MIRFFTFSLLYFFTFYFIRFDLFIPLKYISKNTCQTGEEKWQRKQQRN